MLLVTVELPSPPIRVCVGDPEYFTPSLTSFACFIPALHIIRLTPLFLRPARHAFYLTPGAARTLAYARCLTPWACSAGKWSSP